MAPDARLRGYCEQLIANLGYSGAGCAQFLVDDVRSTVSFLEINPRLDATCAIPYYCGYDFPRMAVECVGHRLGMVSQVSRNLDEYTAGRVGVWLYGDLQGLLEAWRRKELSLKSALLWLGRMSGSFVRADFHLVWSWRDPLPAMVLYAHLPAALVSRGAGKLRSLLGRIPLPGRRSPY